MQSGDSILVNWNSKVGPHSCSFNIDWLREHDYTTPHVHKERMDRNEPLIAVSGYNSPDGLKCFYDVSFYRVHYQLQITMK